MLKKLLFLPLVLLLFGGVSSAFVLGLKSTDNTIENFQQIEKTYQLYLPLVAFIYDPWERQDVVAELEKMAQELGN
ncbi:MAG: hypothetical protein DLD55_02615, partial [candidate division SR1 bacterium]